jgi:hypothetical protein
LGYFGFGRARDVGNRVGVRLLRSLKNFTLHTRTGGAVSLGIGKLLSQFAPQSLSAECQEGVPGQSRRSWRGAIRSARRDGGIRMGGDDGISLSTVSVGKSVRQ